MSTPQSPRELLQTAIYDQLNYEKFNAPYGIIRGKDKSGKFRTIAFGISRVLDAEIRIYSSTFLLLKWTTTIRKLAHTGTEKFDSPDQLLTFIRNNF